MATVVYNVCLLCWNHNMSYFSQNHSSAWPFLEPVKKSEVPDYYDVIKSPMGKNDILNTNVCRSFRTYRFLLCRFFWLIDFKTHIQQNRVTITFWHIVPFSIRLLRAYLYVVYIGCDRGRGAVAQMWKLLLLAASSLTEIGMREPKLWSLKPLIDFPLVLGGIRKTCSRAMCHCNHLSSVVDLTVASWEMVSKVDTSNIVILQPSETPHQRTKHLQSSDISQS